MGRRIPLPPTLVFDLPHYQRINKAREAFLRSLLPELKRHLPIECALDAGCGAGSFSGLLRSLGLRVAAFDGRPENVEEARRRYPEIEFLTANIEDLPLQALSRYDLVLCFGLLYHLENPFRAIRNLYAVTGRLLLIESMCVPDERPWMLLRNEPSLEDQSLTDVAFYASEGCLVKMLYRAGFAAVYRSKALPDHDDFRDTPDHAPRRTVLFASPTPVSVAGFVLLPEPHETSDPWEKFRAGSATLPQRLRRFAARPAREKYAALAQRFRRVFPGVPIPYRLPFGAWFLAGSGTIDIGLLWGAFESAEIRFVKKFLQPGMTVLDIGAHHGLYTLLASKRVGPGGKVIAFEPSPRERRQLARNVRLNLCSNVCIESCALGGERSQADLFLVAGGEDGCNSLRPPAVNAGTQTVRVDVVPLDEYLSNAGIGRVDFVKLDVEGAERDVLRGAAHLLKGASQPVILAEVQDIRTQPWGYPACELLELLDRAGYEWYRLLTSGGLAPIAIYNDAYDSNLVAVPRDRASEVFGRTDEL